MYNAKRFYDYPSYSQWLDEVQQTKNINIQQINTLGTYIIITYIEEDKVIE